jgi:hypothetical protein
VRSTTVAAGARLAWLFGGDVGGGALAGAIAVGVTLSGVTLNVASLGVVSFTFSGPSAISLQAVIPKAPIVTINNSAIIFFNVHPSLFLAF